MWSHNRSLVLISFCQNLSLKPTTGSWLVINNNNMANVLVVAKDGYQDCGGIEGMDESFVTSTDTSTVW
jgi:hypothetical protein